MHMDLGMIGHFLRQVYIESARIDKFSFTSQYNSHHYVGKSDKLVEINRPHYRGHYSWVTILNYRGLTIELTRPVIQLKWTPRSKILNTSNG